MKARLPGVRAAYIEPVAALREAGHRKGVPADELTDGDALDLQFKDGEFDFVTAFAILHHIREPRRAVAEMLRVAKQGIFISDANNYAQGTAISRPIKQVIHALGLWKLFDFAKTRGKGYIETEEDGISYSYSVFNDYPYLRERCGRVHVINIANITRMNKGAIHDAKGINPYRNASTVALLAIKEPWATVED
ncbi:MAG: class I SAM-dependent methyltransferase [Verrucomicrobiales bacterium]